jgi:hypothetical protein
MGEKLPTTSCSCNISQDFTGKLREQLNALLQKENDGEELTDKELWTEGVLGEVYVSPKEERKRARTKVRKEGEDMYGLTDRCWSNTGRNY